MPVDPASSLEHHPGPTMKGEAPSAASQKIKNRVHRLGGSTQLSYLIHLFLLLLSYCICKMQAPPHNMPKLTFASINCNSLNMSSIGNLNHLLKVYGVTSLKTDIILLSDIRLCNQTAASNATKLVNSFRINPHCSYKFFHNSHSNKRGVGILIKQTINFSVLAEEREGSGEQHSLPQARY